MLLTPDQCVPVASAVVRVFNENGDRTDRTKARLKYVLDRWGHDKYVAEIEKHLPFKLIRFPLAECEPRPAVNKHGHLGIHPQKQSGLFYVGVLLPVGRDAHGSDAGTGRSRGQIWQRDNSDDRVAEPVDFGHQGKISRASSRASKSLGFTGKRPAPAAGWSPAPGNAGCKFAASNTKRHALAVADHLDAQLELDQPINIHVTGCPNSCAQHYLGDIGMLGTKVEVGDDMVEGYHVFLGGGYGADQMVGREMFKGVVAEDLPHVVERMLRG